MSKLSRYGALIVLLVAALPNRGQAAEVLPGWLQARDQNPFVLASGLPLAPTVPPAGNWQLDATFTVANTELEQTSGPSFLQFDAETQEFRFSAAYAFNECWSLRGSISHLSINDGFLDSTIEGYHRLFGFSNGDRGLLGTKAPSIRVELDGATLYSLDHDVSGTGPLLIDLTRTWTYGQNSQAGISLGSKWSTGSTSKLTDTGSTDFSLSAHTLYNNGRMTLGARAGFLIQGDNDLLGAQARDNVPFASVLFRYKPRQYWSYLTQIDAHGALYEGLPDFFAASSQLTIGASRRFGDSAEFIAWFSEDFPALRSTDIAFGLNLRVDLD
ncbi:DUF3187 family protein [Dokdonella sp.]|uniref:DUF3187 family protein n=1 Tax=Dokdonella sp. TaxID=2291710 RepID=UPI0035297F11